MIRPVTQDLWDQTMLDLWPRGTAAIVDFGIDSQEHFEALYDTIRSGDITIEQLDAALGKGPELTALVNGCPDNRHPGIKFHTAWDDLNPDLQEEEDPDALWSFGPADKDGPA